MMHSQPTIEPRRYLFVLFEGGGNVPPMLGLARRLVERGHSVRVISDPANEPEVKAAGCEFTAYRRAPHRHDKTAESTFLDDYAARNPTQALFTILDKLVAGPALDFAQDVLDELQSRPVDLVVVNELLFGGYFAAEKAGIPSVMVIPGIYGLYAPQMPPPGMMPLSGLLGWMRDKMYARLFDRIIAHAFPALQNARQALGLPVMKNILEYLYQLDRILVLTSPSFEFPAKFPPNLRYCGPIIDDPVLSTTTWNSPWDKEDGRPLVVVGFSTTYQQHERLLQKVIDAFEELPYRALVTLGPAINETQLHAPSNVVLSQFVPHTRLFPLASAVITHAGHGTVIRALAHGLPLVCIPIGRDQPSNAARVVARGAGLRLSPTAETAAISRALQKVVEVPSFRENARALSRLILQDAGSTAAVDELERIVNQRAPAALLLTGTA